MTMIFRHGFFHGDPHPANILLPTTGADRPRRLGAVGKLTDDDMTKLTGLFIDAANENIEQLPNGRDLGVRYPRDGRRNSSGELRELYYRYYGASLSEIDPVQVDPRGLRAHLRDEPPPPARFLLLDRTIATLASVGRSSIPTSTSSRSRGRTRGPHARAVHPGAGRAPRAERRRSGYAQIARETPYQFHDFMEEIRDGQIEVGFVHKGLDEFMAKFDVAVNRLVVALIVVGGLIGSSIIGIFATGGPHAGVNVISVVGFALSAALGAGCCGA